MKTNREYLPWRVSCYPDEGRRGMGMLCVIAKLPDGAAEMLSALRETVLPGTRLRSPLYGHITLATYLPEDDHAFTAECASMLRGYASFTVRYERIEVFSETSVVVAVPDKTKELEALHGCIAGRFGDSLDLWTRGDRWYPHTTLYHDPAADLESVCLAMRKHFVPFEARIDRIEFSRVEIEGYTIKETVGLR